MNGLTHRMNGQRGARRRPFQTVKSKDAASGRGSALNNRGERG